MLHGRVSMQPRSKCGQGHSARVHTHTHTHTHHITSHHITSHHKRSTHTCTLTFGRHAECTWHSHHVWCSVRKLCRYDDWHACVRTYQHQLRSASTWYANRSTRCSAPVQCNHTVCSAISRCGAVCPDLAWWRCNLVVKTYPQGAQLDRRTYTTRPP